MLEHLLPYLLPYGLSLYIYKSSYKNQDDRFCPQGLVYFTSWNILYCELSQLKAVSHND